jgi:uncharacterized membrane protein YphA (DoxX/SURF4 family)
MKATKIFYWITTVLVSLMMLFSAYSYLTNPQMAAAFKHLGYPDYFRIELAIAKLIGVILLIVPFAGRLKEWVYAGFTIVFISAFISHSSSGDPVFMRAMPVIALLFLAVSYFTYHKTYGTAKK